MKNAKRKIRMDRVAIVVAAMVLPLMMGYSLVQSKIDPKLSQLRGECEITGYYCPQYEKLQEVRSEQKSFAKLVADVDETYFLQVKEVLQKEGLWK